MQKKTAPDGTHPLELAETSAVRCWW